MTIISRLVLLALTLFIAFLSVCAAPVAMVERDETDQSLDKRTTHTGRGTWFYPGLGACGYTDGSGDPIVAISSKRWGTGSNCDQWLKITADGKTAYARARDECPSCGSGDLDMSPSLFEKFASLDVGVLSISWNFQPKGWAPS